MGPVSHIDFLWAIRPNLLKKGGGVLPLKVIFWRLRVKYRGTGVLSMC